MAESDKSEPHARHPSGAITVPCGTRREGLFSEIGPQTHLMTLNVAVERSRWEFTQKPESLEEHRTARDRIEWVSRLQQCAHWSVIARSPRPPTRTG